MPAIHVPGSPIVGCLCTSYAMYKNGQKSSRPALEPA
ncbi:MAG: hypothetical protein BWZ10_00263 [candidate division BRC1 bacterium ADurb.BinA364]|nr:MAG: hypothetical protein BWZ10_00263 [candidate division BRC1 bacterium ADurb.BinA364]